MDKLQNFKHLAWDFDETLINHHHSPLFWDYIMNNPLKQIHSIITMRSHGMQNRIFSILEDHDSLLTRSNFKHVISIPDDIFDEFYSNGNNKIYIPDDNDPYMNFKGKMCNQIGAEVLIDDMDGCNISMLGCKKYDIIHYHPDRLSPSS